MYRRDRVALLSIQTTRAQTVALRASMGLEPWAATQPMLGMAYYCDGCRTWASSVERPSVDMLLLMNGGDEAKRRYYSWVTKVISTTAPRSVGVMYVCIGGRRGELWLQ